MIAPRSTSYNLTELNHEEMVQAALALLHPQRQAVAFLRWDCDICGMIHMGTRPWECDSCGSLALSQRVDVRCEMHTRW